MDEKIPTEEVKKKPDRKATNKMFSIYEKHLEMLQHIKEDKGMGSYSEVFRQALTFYHDKMYPKYIFHLSPAAARKKRQDADQKAFAEISPEDYAKQVGAVIGTEKATGKKFAFVHAQFNGAFGWPLEELKERFTKDPVGFNFTCPKTSLTPFQKL